MADGSNGLEVGQNRPRPGVSGEIVLPGMPAAYIGPKLQRVEGYLEISIAEQRLRLIGNGTVQGEYPVSTAKNGPGQMKGSECTPTGWHRIRAKIGAGQPIYTVFKARRATGEIYTPALAAAFPERDWILSRILWLGGLEPGLNRYREVDSTWRYIYIHGAPDEALRGVPESHGCIRMKNSDVIALFDVVQVGCRVWIHE